MDIHLLWAHINYGNYYLVQHCEIYPRANYVQDIGCQRDDGDRRLLGSNRNVHVRYCSCRLLFVATVLSSVVVVVVVPRFFVLLILLFVVPSVSQLLVVL